MAETGRPQSQKASAANAASVRIRRSSRMLFRSRARQCYCAHRIAGRLHRNWRPISDYTSRSQQSRKFTRQSQPAIDSEIYMGNSVLHQKTLFRDVDTVKELPDILVLHGGRLLDGGRALRHLLNVVASKNNLVLGSRRLHNLDTCYQCRC